MKPIKWAMTASVIACFVFALFAVANPANNNLRKVGFALQNDIDALNESGFLGLYQKYDLSKFNHKVICIPKGSNIKVELYNIPYDEYIDECLISVDSNGGLLATFRVEWYVSINEITLQELNDYVFEVIVDYKPVLSTNNLEAVISYYYIPIDKVNLILTIYNASPSSSPEILSISLGYNPNAVVEQEADVGVE